ncbi:MAG: cell division protein FtsH, partial [candidate division Zixibacteria bacterium]|nr:cell division protein FtsH [candidate division Zixibacteria bacterium]
VTFGKSEDHIFLGREMARHKDYSEQSAVIIDSEIRSFIEKAENITRDILKKNIDKLHKLAKTLLEKEIVDGAEVDIIIGRSSGDVEPVETPAPTPEK